jgi:aminopeptidase N
LAAGNLSSISQEVPGTHPGQQPRTISLWSPPDVIQNFHFALYSAATILPKYELMFDYPYFLPKLDIFALPNFAYLAMENWGLLIFDLERIMIDPLRNPLSFRQVAATTVPSLEYLFGTVNVLLAMTAFLRYKL